MSSLYRKNLRRYKCILIFAVLLQLISCKKEVVEVDVDAFAQLAAKVNFDKGVYVLKFTLQDYQYDEVGVRLSSDKSIFVKQDVMNKQIAVAVASNEYAVFYDSLIDDTTYFYQVYIKDPLTSRLVYSDVFAFKTNP